MVCTQPPAQQRRLICRGKADLFTTIQKFGRLMPMAEECDRLAHSPRPEMLRNKKSFPARRGFLLAYPARHGAFPALFEHRDAQTGDMLCIDTRRWLGMRGIALLIEPGSYDFRWDGRRMLVLPNADPFVIDAFPQESSRWYPYLAGKGIPVETGGMVDGSGHLGGRFLERTESAWFGMPSMEINSGNWDEKYFRAFSRPSLPQGIFTWGSAAPQQRAEHNRERRVPRRRMVSVPAAPPQEKQEASPVWEPKILYRDFVREWNITRSLHSLDPRNYPDPGPVPDQKTFERLLSEGKIKTGK